MSYSSANNVLHIFAGSMSNFLWQLIQSHKFKFTLPYKLDVIYILMWTENGSFVNADSLGSRCKSLQQNKVVFLSYIFQHPFLILICILCAWREYGVCKHGCTSASFGTELDTSTYPPSTSFLFRHTRYFCICFRFIDCEHHVLIVWTVEMKTWLCIKHITLKLWGTL